MGDVKEVGVVVPCRTVLSPGKSLVAPAPSARGPLLLPRTPLHPELPPPLAASPPPRDLGHLGLRTALCPHRAGFYFVVVTARPNPKKLTVLNYLLLKFLNKARKERRGVF